MPENTPVFHSDSSGKEKDSETGYHYFGARYYNSDLSIWLSVDPMADKYPSLSPYNYCAWNPLKIVDPDGRDGEIVVDTDKKTINVNVNIVLYATSRNMSGKKLQYAAQKYKQNIMDKWGAQDNGEQWTTKYNGEEYAVSFNVNISVDNTKAYDGNKTYDGMTNYIEVVDNIRSNVKNGNNGIWAMPTDSKNSAAHEFGHLLGLKDRYSDAKGNISVPNLGWEGNIMSNSRQPVEQRNIDAIFNRNGSNLIDKALNGNKSLGLFGGCTRKHIYKFNLNKSNREK